jgi:hypothetical protein
VYPTCLQSIVLRTGKDTCQPKQEQWAGEIKVIWGCYIQFGFSKCGNNNASILCVICRETLTDKEMKPHDLKEDSKIFSTTEYFERPESTIET